MLCEGCHSVLHMGSCNRVKISFVKNSSGHKASKYDINLICKKILRNEKLPYGYNKVTVLNTVQLQKKNKNEKNLSL